VLDLIRGVCRVTEADDAVGAAEKIRQTLGRAGMDPAKLAPHLLDLLGYKDGTEGLDLVAPDAIKVGISEALRQIDAGRQPSPALARRDRGPALGRSGVGGAARVHGGRLARRGGAPRDLSAGVRAAVGEPIVRHPALAAAAIERG
jgi:hypothetical protein